MFKRLINWIAGVEQIEDPNDYGDILADISLEEIKRRLEIDDEDDTANFYLEVEEME